MNNKKSPYTMHKRMILRPEFDDSRRDHSSELAKKKSDQPISLLGNMTSFPPGRVVIDAQTYVDAQSNGFTKRIVRYDEESKKTPKVFNRIYKRPGDFPIVHLDKPKLVLTPKRSIANPPKMARIGQPEASNYRTNVRAEILRNGTLMPQISVDRREDVDSVRVDPLDALKEISRKRIHCEDTINQVQPAPIEKDTTDSIPCGTNYNNSKRQRTSFSGETNRKGNNSSKCNEILSSLSSSSYMLSPVSPPTSKRSESNSPSGSVLSPSSSIQSDKPIETPTIETTINSVPKAVEKIVPEIVDKIYPTTESTRPKLTLFNRPYSANSPVLPPVTNDRNDECSLPFVKPRPMTARSRESVENWLKIKPDEKRRLALMLSCLSGEVDDGDTVDSKEPVIETPAPKLASSIVASDNSSKEVRGENSTAENSITTTVTSTAHNSTTTSLLPSKPVITFNPISSVTTTTPVSLPTSTTILPTSTIVLPTSTTVQPAVQERKGGFSFPMATKEPPSITAVLSPKPANDPPTVATVTASQTNVISKEDSIPTSTQSVTFTFHQPKPTVAPPVVSSVETTKTFSFGNVSNNEPKTVPAFGSTTADPVKQTTSVGGTFMDPKKPVGLGDTSKPTSFAAFGQTTSVGNVDFGKTISSSVAAPTASIFGTMTSSDAFNKAQPPSFGSISTNDKPVQSNTVPTFSKNEQTPVFGSNPQKPADPRTLNNATATSFISNQLGKPTTTTSFAFGASTTASSAFKIAQPTFSSTTSSSGFDAKPINSTTNVFESSTAAPMFGSSTNTNTFDQTPKMGTIKTSNSAEPERNIFGSTAAKPSPAFSFSANQPSTNNIFGGQTAAENGTGSATGNAFNFGGSSQKSDLSSVGTNKSFSFSGNNGETTKPVAFGSKTPAPTFGSSNITDSAKSVGFAANNQTNSTNLFSNKSTNEAPKPFSFGGNSNTPAGATNGAAATFGGSAMPSSFGGSSAVPSFGSTNATPTFGSTNATPTFGSTNATPAFGSTNATPAFGSTNATPIFGGANAPPAFGGNSNAPTFGGINATKSFGGNSAAPSFGANSATSAFGGNSAPSAFGGASAPSAFGGASAPSAFGGASAPSAFGTTSAPSAFGGTNAPSAFGGTNATQAFGGTNAPPSFGATNAMPTFGANNTPPNFGGNNATQTFGGAPTFNANVGAPSFGSTLNSSSSSGFGGNSGTPGAFTTSTGTADVNKTFNFTGNDPAPSPVPNLFNIGPGNPAPRGRTIRTATRRTYR